MTIAATGRQHLVQEPHRHHWIGAIEHFLHLDSHALAGNLEGREGRGRIWRAPTPSQPWTSHLGVEPFPHPGVADSLGQFGVETELRGQAITPRGYVRVDIGSRMMVHMLARGMHVCGLR